MEQRDSQPPENQPLGFWAVRAGEAIGAHTRGALEKAGIRQPEWWVLHQLSLHPDGIDRAVLVDTIGPNESVAVAELAIESTTQKQWLSAEGDILQSTDVGRQKFEIGSAVQRDLREIRRKDISDEEFYTTISVLRKTIENIGVKVWHW